MSCCPVIRSSSDKPPFSTQQLLMMTTASCRNIYAGKLLQKCRLLEFLILLNDMAANHKNFYAAPVNQNENILKILHYIDSNLTQNLSITQIADAVHLNSSYLMHKFKKETGYTIGELITEKRLFFANSLIKNGVPPTQACYRSGFSNYSSFYRAYVQKYGFSPKKQRDFTLQRDAEILE